MLDEEKIAEIYDSFARELIVYIHGFVRSREVAEDLLHETFIRLIVHARREAFYEKNVRALLYTIARNLAIDYIRRLRAGEALHARAMPGAAVRSPDLEVEHRELEDRIDRFMAALSPLDRSVFIMKKELQLTYGEMAEILGISERTAKRRMQRMLIKLSGELENEGLLLPSIIVVALLGPWFVA